MQMQTLINQKAVEEPGTKKSHSGNFRKPGAIIPHNKISRKNIILKIS